MAMCLMLVATMAPRFAAAFDEGNPALTYQPADSSVCPGSLTLHQHKGRYVELLLSDTWESGLTTDERHTILDRADIVYQYYKEILQVEPATPATRPSIGLLRIAVVPAMCVKGNAWTTLGVKEMEIADTDANLQMYKKELARGLETNRQITSHEIGHAFDVWGGYLEYETTCDNNSGTNWCHAWTDVWDAFIPYYGRVSGIYEYIANQDLTADAHQRWWTNNSYAPYYSGLSNPAVNWTNAVKNEDLSLGIKARDSWAGIMDRYVQLYGTDALVKSMGYIRNFVASNPAPASQEGKEHLHILAMAAGAHANLSCFLDKWRWYSADGKSSDVAMRNEMAALYGPASGNPMCADADGDGYTPLQGDCNDANPSIYPGATDVANGIDDDCDGSVDNAPQPAVPLAPWGKIAPAAKQDGNYLLSASTLTTSPPVVNATPTRIRFWVTGVGVVGVVPYTSNASFLWTPPAGLPAGSYGYRAQLMNDTRPVSDFTAVQWFDVGSLCTPDRYEAEFMNHTTGNPFAQGWNVYDSNGYISFNHIFTAGMQQMTVRAQGQFAAGAWPNMRVTVGGVQVFNGTVSASSWTDYAISFYAPAGNAEVRIYFTNDYYQPGPPVVDRNLQVDRVTLAVPQCNPPPMTINLGAVNNETDFLMNGRQPLVINQLTFSGWTPGQIVVGIGHDDAPNLNGVSVSVNGGAPVALSGDWRTITIPFTGQSAINLTVYSATTRALRIQWWAQQ